MNSDHPSAVNTEINNADSSQLVSQGIVSGILKGDNKSVARAISKIEDEMAETRDLLRKIYPHTGNAFIIGVTGPPGTGKSTLVDRMISFYRESGTSVGVLNIDPSSPFSGGALLGDRVRMIQHSLDSGVFIRSMASRGNLGGFSRATRNALRILDAAGKEIVILETVGVGQDEVEIMNAVDATVVILAPQLGDDIQMTKAGLMEIGSIFVVNKADLENADRTFHDVRQSVTKRGDWKPPVFKTNSLTGEGINELMISLAKFRKNFLESGAKDTLMRKRIQEEILEKVTIAYAKHARERISHNEMLKEMVDRALSKEVDPDTASNAILETVFGIVDLDD